MIATVLVAAALTCPQESKLQAMLPDVFAKSAAHYRAIDAAGNLSQEATAIIRIEK